jgi:hypothetical protein
MSAKRLPHYRNRKIGAINSIRKIAWGKRSSTQGIMRIVARGDDHMERKWIPTTATKSTQSRRRN